MRQPTLTREKFWQERYFSGGKLYGNAPSMSAGMALNYFLNGTFGKTLELCCGTGRNLFLFAHYGIECSGIDISDKAIKLAICDTGNLSVKFSCEDVLTSGFYNKNFDSVFVNYSLPLFTDEELEIIFTKIYDHLEYGGLLISSWLNPKDHYSKTGYSGGQYIKCHQEEELRRLYVKKRFELLRIEEHEEIELIDGKKRETWMWFTVAKKI